MFCIESMEHNEKASNMLRYLNIWFDPKNRWRHFSKKPIVRITFDGYDIICEHYGNLTKSQKEKIRDFMPFLHYNHHTVVIDSHGNKTGNILIREAKRIAADLPEDVL